MPDPLQPFLNLTNQYPIIWLGLAVIIIYFIFDWLKKRGDKNDNFEYETLEETILKYMNKKFKLVSMKTRAGLSQGFAYFGDVDSWARERGKHIPRKYDADKETYVLDDKAKERDYDLYIFRIWQTNFLFKFLGFGDKTYVIVDANHLTNIDIKSSPIRGSFKTWNIKPEIQFMRIGGHFVSSEAGLQYLTDISILKSHEDLLTYNQNYSKKLVYLELQHAKMINMLASKKRIETESWNKYKKAEGEDIEAEVRE